MAVDFKQIPDGHAIFKDEATGNVLGHIARVAQVTLSAAQVIAADATPVTVLAAPGAGKVIVIRNITATKAAGTAYTSVGSGDDLIFSYTDSSGAIAATIETTGLLDSTAATISRTGGASCIPVANAAIVAYLGGTVATGNSPVKLRIEYDILDVPVF